MKSNVIVKKVITEFRENELIFACKVYKDKLADKVSVAAYYKTLQRMCESNELVKIAKGTYYRPKIGRYGSVPLSEKEIVKAFTEDETGIVVGYSLYNNLNLTTQVGKYVRVMSSTLDGMSKSVRNVTISKMPIVFTPEVRNIVEGLEVLQEFYSIQDMNYSSFIIYSRKLAASFESNAFNDVISVKTYKKSTISFLKEVLDYYSVDNNLNEYLSSMSKYKHPKMEDIYEAAQLYQ